jgi:hypothetical protein
MVGSEGFLRVLGVGIDDSDGWKKRRERGIYY